MSKRKIILLATALSLVAILAVGGTLAYFTDTDYDKNVMVIGNIAIVQNERDRFGSDFVDGNDLYPAVITGKGSVEKPEKGYWDEEMNNEIDKFITVTNTGSRDAYVRTIIAFETARHYAPGSNTEFTDMHDVYMGVLGDFKYLNPARYITVDGVEYVLAMKVYDAALAPGYTTEPSLKQVFLAPTADNETSSDALFGSEYTILAVSQGVQTAGFTSAEEALNTAFGDVNTVTNDVLLSWFDAN